MPTTSTGLVPTSRSLPSHQQGTSPQPRFNIQAQVPHMRNIDLRTRLFQQRYYNFAFIRYSEIKIQRCSDILPYNRAHAQNQIMMDAAQMCHIMGTIVRGHSRISPSHHSSLSLSFARKIIIHLFLLVPIDIIHLSYLRARNQIQISNHASAAHSLQHTTPPHAPTIIVLTALT